MQKRNGIQWMLWTQLDNIHYADDLSLLSYIHQQMQEKINTMETSRKTDLNIHQRRTKILKATL